MHNIKIRRTIKDDVKALTALAVKTWTDAFAHSFSEASDVADHIEKSLSESYFNQAVDNDLILIAEEENRMIGFIQIGHMVNAKEPEDRELRRIYVVANFQSKGVGKLLMDKALSDPYLESTQNIYLDVWEHNLGAQKLYKKYGFAVIGKRKLNVPSGAETSSDLIMVRRSSKNSKEKSPR